MSTAYVRPTIERNRPGQMNPQARGDRVEPCAAIDGVAVEQLARDHGSPLYVFSEATLRRAYRDLHGAFARRYPDVQFAWSYKTNYLRAICAIFHQEGAIAEVVSDFEYEKARGLGIPGEAIIFNGPHKPRAALERAVDEDARIQVDNLDELLLLADVASTRGRTIDVALRVHFDCGVRPAWTKFGFSADGPEFDLALERLAASGSLRLAGLHTHVGTFILDPQVYARASARLVELAAAARNRHGFEVTSLNLGGGFPSRSQLHFQYYPADQVVPSLDDYAEAVCRPILEGWPRGRPLPRLYLENGRALVDEAGSLVTTVVAVKSGQALARAVPAAHYDRRKKAGHAVTGPGRHGNLLVDAGVNLLHTAAWYRFGVRPARPMPGPLHERTIYGCLCMNIDVLREGVALPDCEVGDLLVFHPVGAYNVTQSMQFISYRPRIVLVSEGGGVEVIREREDLRHVEALERLPERLATFPAPGATP
ncbi:MAG: alanine racemase [Planctomycetaceae bacterium]